MKYVYILEVKKIKLHPVYNKLFSLIKWPKYSRFKKPPKSLGLDFGTKAFTTLTGLLDSIKLSNEYHKVRRIINNGRKFNYGIWIIYRLPLKHKKS